MKALFLATRGNLRDMLTKKKKKTLAVCFSLEYECHTGKNKGSIVQQKGKGGGKVRQGEKKKNSNKNNN